MIQSQSRHTQFGLVTLAARSVRCSWPGGVESTHRHADFRSRHSCTERSYAEDCTELSRGRWPRPHSTEPMPTRNAAPPYLRRQRSLGSTSCSRRDRSFTDPRFGSLEVLLPRCTPRYRTSTRDRQNAWRVCSLSPAYSKRRSVAASLSICDRR